MDYFHSEPSPGKRPQHNKRTVKEKEKYIEWLKIQDMKLRGLTEEGGQTFNSIIGKTFETTVNWGKLVKEREELAEVQMVKMKTKIAAQDAAVPPYKIWEESQF